MRFKIVAAIATSATKFIGGMEVAQYSRKQEIMADAAYVMLCKESKSYTGNFAIDENILREEGITDFTEYAVDPSECLMLLCLEWNWWALKLMSGDF